MKKQILILCGGKSDEHEISLISAKHVLDAMDRSKYSPLVVGISKDGQWYYEQPLSFYRGECRADKISLNTNAPQPTVLPFTQNGQGTLFVEGKEIHFDAAFPILHGPFGEDGTIQGFFDILNVPYVGSNCESSSICMDKTLAKVLCNHHGIRVAEFVIVSDLSELEKKSRDISELGPTVFVKPSRLGSSVGISKVTDRSHLHEAVKLALKHDSKVLIERGIKGREIECAVLGLNDSPRVAIPGEIVVDKTIGFYSYEAKYILENAAQLLVPAPLNQNQVHSAQKLAVRSFQIFECDGMARVDLFLEENTGEFYLSEVNTIPGFTPISMYPKLWQSSGMTYSQLITELIELANVRLKKDGTTRT